MKSTEELKGLTDDELENVAGGIRRSQLMKIQCMCGTINDVNILESQWICSKCKKMNRIDG